MDDDKTKLPEWAEKIVPVDMNGAAVLLGVSRRFLVAVLRDHPHYEPRGTKEVFHPEHIVLLRKALSSAARPTPSRSGPYVPLVSPDTVFERALALAERRSESRLKKPKTIRPR